jgi:hypothetical protein
MKKLEVVCANGEVHTVEAFCKCDEPWSDQETFDVLFEQKADWLKAEFITMRDFCPKCRKFMWYHESGKLFLTDAFR